LAQADADRRLAVSGRRRRDGRDDDELAVGRAAARLERAQVDLGDAAAVGDELGVGQPQTAGDVSDRGGWRGAQAFGLPDSVEVVLRAAH
jgi:hypothetical protein